MGSVFCKQSKIYYSYFHIIHILNHTFLMAYMKFTHKQIDTLR